MPRPGTRCLIGGHNLSIRPGPLTEATLSKAWYTTVNTVAPSLIGLSGLVGRYQLTLCVSPYFNSA